jgi:hypothetical protein
LERFFDSLIETVLVRILRLIPFSVLRLTLGTIPVRIPVGSIEPIPVEVPVRIPVGSIEPNSQVNSSTNSWNGSPTNSRQDSRRFDRTSSR